MIVHAEKDAGEYVSAGMVLARDPQTGLRNVSVNRMQIKAADKTFIRMMPPQQLGLIQAKAEERGERLPIAVAIGNHPLDLVAAATSLPFGEDELELAGALKGEAFELAQAVSQPELEVPAHAEIILEGSVEPGIREPEGPFGDFMQFYVPIMDNHVFRLTAITHRRNPILHAIHAGSSEDVNLLGPSREALILEAARQTGAHVCAVRLLPTILGGAIAIEQRKPGEAKAVAHAAFEAYSWLKYCVVVDHDVDVNSIEDVWWAVCTRSNPDDAVELLRPGGGFPRDQFGTHVSKVLIDATIPLGAWQEFERKRPPGGDSVRLTDFL
jgi:UbiD family decarboxylase